MEIISTLQLIVYGVIFLSSLLVIGKHDYNAKLKNR